MAQQRDRLREPEARILALRIAAAQPGHEAATTLIKENVPDYIALTPHDLKPSTSRNTEKMWQQIVGNVVSHKQNSTSIFQNGYAIRLHEGIKVTEKGLAYLKSLGFSE
jgi:hypothetical protein